MLAALALAAVTALPTISVTVQPSPNVSRSLVALVLEEAGAIWRDVGVRVVVRDEPAPGVVRVIIDDSIATSSDAGLAIGWVIFDDDEPRPEIRLSYANAVAGLTRACPAGTLSKMWKSQIDELVAVALGRVLAHELGHYLLGSAAHTNDGLMHADWSPNEMFGADRPRFRLDATQRATIAPKLVPAQIGTKQ